MVQVRTCALLRTGAYIAAATVFLAATATADIGRIKQVEGEAFIERAGDRQPAQAGATLEQQDALVTGADGRLGVTFIDNSRFSAGPNSRVELSRFSFDPTTHDGNFETNLRSGSLAVISGQIAGKTPDAMRVHTPTAILGVRGTRFVVEVAR